jgi:hypothetical protein
LLLCSFLRSFLCFLSLCFLCFLFDLRSDADAQQQHKLLQVKLNDSEHALQRIQAENSDFQSEKRSLIDELNGLQARVRSLEVELASAVDELTKQAEVGKASQTQLQAANASVTELIGVVEEMQHGLAAKSAESAELAANLEDAVRHLAEGERTKHDLTVALAHIVELEKQIAEQDAVHADQLAEHRAALQELAHSQQVTMAVAPYEGKAAWPARLGETAATGGFSTVQLLKDLQHQITIVTAENFRLKTGVRHLESEVHMLDHEKHDAVLMISDLRSLLLAYETGNQAVTDQEHATTRQERDELLKELKSVQRANADALLHDQERAEWQQRVADGQTALAAAQVWCYGPHVPPTWFLSCILHQVLTL